MTEDSCNKTKLSESKEMEPKKTKQSKKAKIMIFEQKEQ